jgi:hypothetical protein
LERGPFAVEGKIMLAVFVDFALNGNENGRICAKCAVDGCDPKHCVVALTLFITLQLSRSKPLKSGKEVLAN